MLLKSFTIRDIKGELYNTPFFQRSHGEAERNFTALVNDGKSTISQYPEDYDLFWVGEFDDQTGLLKPLDAPKHVASATSVKKPLN